MDLTGLQMLKDAFSLIRDAIGAVKDAKGLLPAAQQQAVTTAIENADRSAAAAEAQIAMALGYHLHRCTFPPQIMLEVQTAHGPEQKCPACGAMTNYNEELPYAGMGQKV